MEYLYDCTKGDRKILPKIAGLEKKRIFSQFIGGGYMIARFYIGKLT